MYGFSAMLMSSCADDCVGLLSAAVTVGKMPVSEGDAKDDQTWPFDFFFTECIFLKVNGNK